MKERTLLLVFVIILIAGPSFGDANSQEADTLMSLLQQPYQKANRFTRRDAASRLGKLQEQASRTLPVLAQVGAKDPDRWTRRRAFWSIAALGSQAKDNALKRAALAALINAKRADADAGNREAAQEAIDIFADYIGPAKYRGHSYRLFLESVTWEEAETACERIGGTLAMVDDKKENQFLHGIALGCETWLGATDKEKEGDWRWTDGRRLRYVNWTAGQPDNHATRGEKYLMLEPSGTWNDAANDRLKKHEMYFICEWNRMPPGCIQALKREEIVGEYTWHEDRKRLGTVVLYPDHSIKNYKGEKKPRYRWRLSSRGLVLKWLVGENVFTESLRSGILSGARKGKEIKLVKRVVRKTKGVPPWRGSSQYTNPGED